MTSDGRIKDGKVQCDINREPAKMPALFSGNIDKYEYLSSEKI